MTEPYRAAGPKPDKPERRRVSGKRLLAVMLVGGMLLIATVVAIAAGGMPSFHAPRVLGTNRKW